MTDDFPPTNDIPPTGNSYGYYDEHYAARQPAGDVGELIEKCRRYADSLVGINDLSCGPLMARCALLEAADEIERLRASLEKIPAMDEVSITDFDGEDGWTHQCVARAALQNG